MGIITIMLIIEFRFFYDQAAKMMELKDEYRAYGMAVKRVLNEYNALKEQVEGAPATHEGQEGSDKEFLIVNRELAYLKKSMLDFLKDQHIDYRSQRIDLNDWRDYTEQVIEATKNKSSSKSTQRKKRARKRIRAPLPQKNYPEFANKGPKDLMLSWPIDRSSFWLSSFYGPRKKPDGSWGFHYGIDLAAVKGTLIHAACDGLVIDVQHSNKGYGNTIVVLINNKYKVRYAHLDKILVKLGQKVQTGQLIGKVGSTGVVRKRGKDASHLHFEVYAHGKQINPLYFFI